jgi:hypothetical protein
MVHDVPSHCSARVSSVSPGVLLSGLVYSPTAMHDVADEHETPRTMTESTSCFGTGITCVVHVVPSHRAATSRRDNPSLSDAYPTAVHAAGDEHDTASRLLIAFGSGVACTVAVGGGLVAANALLHGINIARRRASSIRLPELGAGPRVARRIGPSVARVAAMVSLVPGVNDFAPAAVATTVTELPGRRMADRPARRDRLHLSTGVQASHGDEASVRANCVWQAVRREGTRRR